MTNESHFRQGVSLIEVIFSIGVVLIGLLGLLSIMPIAGRRSQEAASLASAAALGDSVMNELLARKPISNRLLSGMNSGVTSAVDMCIDPVYKGAQAHLVFGDYDDSFFPYIKAAHDPLLNPSILSTPAVAGMPGTEWPVPRPSLVRVGLNLAPSVTAQGRREQGRSFGESRDDIISIRPPDRTENAQLNALKANETHTVNYGKRLASSEFTWISTIDILPGGRYASVSVVVSRNRNVLRDYPDTLAETDPEKNATSERLAYVANAVGFSGGAGGTLWLTASQSTSPKIKVNDWILLSSRVGGDTHRWFRVVMVDGQTELFETSHKWPDQDPRLQAIVPTEINTPVWLQKVLVDGPDWSFGFDNDGASNPDPPVGQFGDNTFATIFTDVVSVTEKTVQVSEL